VGDVNSPRKSAPRVLASSPFARPEPEERALLDLRVGDRVTHDQHGLGRVVTAGSEYATVDFGDGVVLCISLVSRDLTKI
jgi:hypothetical protein